MLCPECGSPQIHRSHRRGPLERFVYGPVGVFAFRCDHCRTRFLDFKPKLISPIRSVRRGVSENLGVFFWTLGIAFAAMLIIILLVALVPR